MVKKFYCNRVGIILAGGLGTRLYPLTKVINKHLLPIFDKPMIFYPLEFLIKTGHKKIIIITNPGDNLLYKKLIKNFFNEKIIFLSQKKPIGIPDAYNLASKYIKITFI